MIRGDEKGFSLTTPRVRYLYAAGKIPEILYSSEYKIYLIS